VAATIRLDADGNLVGQPRRSKHPRVEVVIPEGAEGTSMTSGPREPREGPLTKSCPVSVEGLRALRDDPEQRRIFASAATDFRAFLRVWKFLDQETGQVRILGDSLWPAQEEYVRASEEHPWLYMLKARQLGETTVAIAFDAWVARFRDHNARVHVFSTGDDQSKEVLDCIRFGLERLPPSLQLPMQATTRSIRLDYADGRAFIRSYPSTRAASRGSTCTHLHLDEWSAMIFPAKVMQSVTPTVAPQGSFHILCTEAVGPESDSADYFRKAIDGNAKHFGLFVSALARPDRDDTWLEAMRRSLPKAEMSREYPQTWEEALSSAGERMFNSDDLVRCADPEEQFGVFRSQAEYEHRYRHIFEPDDGRKPRRRKYTVGVDIGLKADATVIVVCDVTTDICNVVGFERLTQPSVGDVQRAIEDTFARWPSAHITIEDSGIGFPIRQGVNIPESRCHGVLTTGISKPRMLGALQFQVENHLLHYDADACPNLDRELRVYTTPDTHITTDCVMALCFAINGAEHAHNSSAGRILGAFRV
jgi:hypothetical protein